MTDERLYSIGEVAALLGVSTHTIRAWERRHGILHPERTQTQQRRYRSDDIDLLRELKRAIDLNGLSLRLAYDTVRGAVVPAYPREPRERPRAQPNAQPLALTSDTSLWRAIGNVLPQLILVVDQEGTIIEANTAVARTFGTVLQRLTGRKLIDMVDPYDRGKASMLYRPQFRAVSSWELNLSTARGARLFSFQSWTVRQNEEILLALIGSEMFAEARGVNGPDVDVQAPEAVGVPAALRGEAAVIQTVQNLLQKLPFGLAVATIGRPPRIVYANSRLFQSLGARSGRWFGRRLEELLPDRNLIKAFRYAVTSRRARILRSVRLRPRGSAARRPRFVNLAFGPVSTSTDKVVSTLVVVEDATAEEVSRTHLAKLVAAQKLDKAKTVEQLATMGVRRLAKVFPEFNFVIQLMHPHEAKLTVAWSEGWSKAALGGSTAPVINLLERAGTADDGSDVTTDVGPSSMRISAAPLLATRSGQPARHLGAVAWSSRPAAHEQHHENAAIDAFVAQLAQAAELLHIRAEASRMASRLDAVINAAGAAGESAPGRSGLGVTFLERLTKAVNGTSGAVGVIQNGGELIIEAAYSVGQPLVRRGDVLAMSGHFIAESIKSGEPTATSRLRAMVGLPGPKRRLGRIKHGLSVPLMLRGRPAGAIIVWRALDVPFNEDDVVLVQTLSSVGLLAAVLRQLPGEI